MGINEAAKGARNGLRIADLQSVKSFKARCVDKGVDKGRTAKTATINICEPSSPHGASLSSEGDRTPSGAFISTHFSTLKLITEHKPEGFKTILKNIK